MAIHEPKTIQTRLMPWVLAGSIRSTGGHVNEFKRIPPSIAHHISLKPLPHTSRKKGKNQKDEYQQQ